MMRTMKGERAMEAQEKKVVFMMPEYLIAQNMWGQTVIRIFDEKGYLQREWLFEKNQPYGVVWANHDTLKIKVIWCRIREEYHLAVKVFNARMRMVGKWRFVKPETVME